MMQLTETERARLRDYPIESVLAAFGKSTAHGRDNCYYSPFRQEARPSFHISRDGIRWYDFGIGAGGSAVALVCRLLDCNAGHAYDFLANLSSSYIPVRTGKSSNARSSRPSRIRIISVRDTFSSKQLLDYAKSRGISPATLGGCCSEVVFGYEGRGHFSGKAIGLRNNRGGWILRAPDTKKCTSSETTTIDIYGTCSDVPTSRCGVLFEGMFDYLTFREIIGEPGCDACVLNSVNNIARAGGWIASHDRLFTFMDDDEAGRTATLRIRRMASERGKCIEINDWSFLYEGFNDLNGRMTINAEERESLTINLQSLWNNQFQRTFRKD